MHDRLSNLPRCAHTTRARGLGHGRDVGWATGYPASLRKFSVNRFSRELPSVHMAPWPPGVNQTMERKYYTTPAGITSKDFSEAQPEAYHKPPGAWRNEKPRGRLGPKRAVHGASRKRAF